PEGRHGRAPGAWDWEPVRPWNADLRSDRLHQAMVQRAPAAGGVSSRLRTLSDEVRALEKRLREGGGADKVAKQHKQGKLTARERVDALRDQASRFIEVGLLVAYDQYDGQAPAAGV